MITIRNSPVKISTFTPSYLPNLTSPPTKSSTLVHDQPKPNRPDVFRYQTPGFGSRHVYDDAPFTLWVADTREFREPTQDEMTWIFKKYQAFNVLIDLPDIIIRTNYPPSQIPLTVAGALARFVPSDLLLLNLPHGAFCPYSTSARDILSYSLPKFAIPSHPQSMEVIDLLSPEMDIRAVHFLPPLIIVELDAAGGRKYDRKSLPGKAGGLNIMYHDSIEEFWKGSSQKAYERLLTPTDLVTDVSDYLYNDPHQLSPGVCLSSAYLSRSGAVSSQYLHTTAGVLVQNGATRLMTSANHGFPTSDEAYHPSPTGRRIGQVVQRIPDLDVALVQLDPSISFSNRRYFAAHAPARLVSVEELDCGDWFEVDGMSTGRFDLCVRGRSWYSPRSTEPIPHPVRSEIWHIETSFSLFGPTGAQVKEGICGAPIVDHDGRVAGLFRLADESGMWAHIPALDSLMQSGWSVV